MSNKLTKTGKKRMPRTTPLLVPQKRSNKPLSKWIKETKQSYQITKKDICYIYRNVVFTKTFGELKAVMENEEVRDSYPVLVISIIAGVLGDIARGNIVNLTRMLQFVFPNYLKGFDPDDFANKAGQGGYDEIKDLEDALRRLEGDDSIMIVDKLLMAEDAKHEFVNDAG